jgi:N-acetylmuramoyl-L-alanine amidase
VRQGLLCLAVQCLVPIAMVVPAGAGAPASPLVVIDAGHGGINTGTRATVAPVDEKDVTLALSRKVAAAVKRRGFEVMLTRAGDSYMTLRQRVALANARGAAVFVSVHTNASPTHAQRGYETFLLTPRAVDVDARALRLADGARRSGVDPEIALVLDDVERGLAHAGAADLAAAVQHQLARVRGAAADRGVRQAPLDVLYGALMPAVLVEVGFLDHPVEGRELLAVEVQGAIAEALAAAIAQVAAR